MSYHMFDEGVNKIGTQILEESSVTRMAIRRDV